MCRVIVSEMVEGVQIGVGGVCTLYSLVLT